MDGRIPTTDNKVNYDSVIVTSVDTGKSSETESDRLTVLERWLASPKTTDSEERLRERISLPFDMWKDTFTLGPENETSQIEDESTMSCESCDPWQEDPCCVGLLNGCKIIIKPMIYDHISPIIIIVPPEHAPIWHLDEENVINLNKATRAVAEVFTNRGQFPNFFTGGNINNARYGLRGVHAHVHVEPRVPEDPAYKTFPAHVNKVLLTGDEIEGLKREWKVLLNI